MVNDALVGPLAVVFARLAYVVGAEEWATAELARGLAVDELAGVVSRFRGSSLNR